MAKQKESRAEFLARFWNDVDHGNLADTSAEKCWTWKSPRAHGYGRIFWNGQGLMVHRVAYEASKGPIPEGLQIDHLCRNPACVRPSHLEAVSSKVNTLRGIGPTAQNAKKQHCAKGHPYTPENTYPRKDGTRQCRICKRRIDKERKLKKRCATLDATPPATLEQPSPLKSVHGSATGGILPKGGDGE